MGTNQEYVSKFWLDWRGTKKWLVAVCFDGASVNTGVINWLQALIKKEFGPWLLVVHCVNHNFELAKKRKLSVWRHTFAFFRCPWIVKIVHYAEEMFGIAVGGWVGGGGVTSCYFWRANPTSYRRHSAIRLHSDKISPRRFRKKLRASIGTKYRRKGLDIARSLFWVERKLHVFRLKVLFCVHLVYINLHAERDSFC